MGAALLLWLDKYTEAEFAEKIGSFVVKPLGKPTLALATDKRETYSPAASDFAGVVSEQ